MRVIIDRFEGEFAVVEMPDKTTVNMPAVLLPENAAEGDVLEITIDHEESQKRKEKISRLMEELWE